MKIWLLEDQIVNSMGIEDVNSKAIYEITSKIIYKCKKNNIKVTIGGTWPKIVIHS